MRQFASFTLRPFALPGLFGVSLVLGSLGLLGAGCAPVIGDDCGDSVDCSVNGDRICDIAQPGGYCSIQNCDADTCPDDAVCVRFRPDPSRLAQSWCMKVCEKSSDCREDQGYTCKLAEELLTFEVEPGVELPVAVDLDVDRPNRRFCAATDGL